jgi:thiol-disulfide isomerase/thioredoxin
MNSRWYLAGIALVLAGLFADRDVLIYFKTRGHHETLAGCTGKSRCITVYVAPWCPVCRQSIPTMRLIDSYLAKNKPDVGINVVVGADRPEKIEEEAKELASLNALADISGEVMRANAVSVYPTWLVRDQAGKEIFRKASGIQIQSEDQVPIILSMLTLN